QINVDELESTKLGLTLLGTVSGTGGFDFAVIEEKNKKKQGLFREGDAIASATIIKIMRGMVVLRVDERDEILKMEEGDQKSEVGGRRSEGRGRRSEVGDQKSEVRKRQENREKSNQ
ncbi:MAG: hypothetical protein KAU60_10365, partial [Desulfobacterales bacterium]|nr:hypothetical protein [Desulfobacterales bacterium]